MSNNHNSKKHTHSNVTLERVDEIANLILADIQEDENVANQIIAEAETTSTIESAFMHIEKMGKLLRKRISFEKELFTKVAEDTKINLEVIPFMKILKNRLSK